MNEDELKTAVNTVISVFEKLTDSINECNIAIQKRTETELQFTKMYEEHLVQTQEPPMQPPSDEDLRDQWMRELATIEASLTPTQRQIAIQQGFGQQVAMADMALKAQRGKLDARFPGWQNEYNKQHPKTQQTQDYKIYRPPTPAQKQTKAPTRKE